MRTYLLAAVVLAGCSRASAPATATLAATDFENLSGWLADQPVRETLTKQQAHSGSYSTSVRPGQDFSLGYNNALSQLAADRPTRLQISAWVQQTGAAPGPKLVTELKSASGSRLLWEGLDIAPVAKVPGKWYRVEQTITLPATAAPDSRLLVYLWRADSTTPTYLDDLQIASAAP
ncbi:MAG: carbohydrate binding domain-containing protein [Janthinobacterium lividum]